VSVLLAFMLAASTVCGDPLSFQVLLDRHGFSPGVIDGRMGQNTARALAAFQQSKGLSASGLTDCDTWNALSSDDSNATVSKYEIKEQDARGPFVKRIPRDLTQQAALPSLGYTSVIELLAERFHASPALLVRMNHRARFEAGSVIAVPAVVPFDANVNPKPRPAPAVVSIDVSRDDSALRVLDAGGDVLFFAPISSGSEHDPLPLGHWKVTSVDWNPTFHYNPELFWDADPRHSRADLKPGPNNPVGVVWIGINVEHYGLHGTPEPRTVGRAQSHGCVRLSNWDAARLASLIGVGTPVVFR
jgi:lipoprotein-anchoring transpeptidase ErfK/SrfK